MVGLETVTSPDLSLRECGSRGHGGSGVGGWVGGRRPTRIGSTSESSQPSGSTLTNLLLGPLCYQVLQKETRVVKINMNI